MKPACVKVFVSAVLAAQGMAAAAQNVYVTPGANGPVYSDKPQQGAKAVTLRPLNVVSPPSGSGQAVPAGDVGKNAAAKPDKTAMEYREFSVLFPEDNGSVVANTALFEVRLAVDPPLQLGEGHAFVVSINGRPVGRRFTATEFMVPPEFWGDQLPPANQALQLDAGILDAQGNMLKRAAPVRFFMRYAVIHQWPASHFRSSGRIRPQDSREDGPSSSQGKEPRKATENRSLLPKTDR